SDFSIWSAARTPLWMFVLKTRNPKRRPRRTPKSVRLRLPDALGAQLAHQARDAGLVGVGRQGAFVEDEGSVGEVELLVNVGQLDQGARVARLDVQCLLVAGASAVEVALAGAEPAVLDVGPGEPRLRAQPGLDHGDGLLLPPGLDQQHRPGVPGGGV